MTINTSTKNPALRTTVSKREKPVYCIDNGKRWPSATACAEDLGVSKLNVWRACNGILKTCKKLHLRYEEDVAGVQEGMSNSLATMSTEVESMRAELERLRAVEKAYNKEQAAKTEREEAIAKLENSIARHQRAYDSYMEHAKTAMKCITEKQQELEALKSGRK